MPDDFSDLSYYHGALPTDDVEKALVNDGDFLIVSRPEDGGMVLCVRQGPRVRRHEMKRTPNGTVMVMNERGPTVRSVVEKLQARGPLARSVPKSKWAIVHRDVKIRKRIGSGAYGTVYQGYLRVRSRNNNNTLAKVAVKRLESEGKTEQGLCDMMKEARVMQMFKHPNIVKFHGYVLDRSPYLLVMELCKDGSVEDKLRAQGKTITVSSRIDMSTQAARGMEYLHGKQCIHRDIATRNCLLHGSCLKLADFGMCRATANYKVDLAKPQNVRWLAPEVWRTGETKYCTDVYAFGIMLWELFEEPFVSPYSKWKALMVKEQVMNGFRMATPDLMPDGMTVVMKRCWDHDPDKRPSAAVLREDLEAINKEYNPNLYNEDSADKSQTNTARTRSLVASVSAEPVCRTPKKKSWRERDS